MPDNARAATLRRTTPLTRLVPGLFLKPTLASLLDGLRLLVLRAPRGRAITAGPGAFMALVALYLAVVIALAAFVPDPSFLFGANDFSTTLADVLLLLIAAWLLVRLAGRDVIWGAAAILLASTIFVTLIAYWPLHFLLSTADVADHASFAGLVILLVLLWWLLALLVLARWLAPHGLMRNLGAALLAWIVSTASVWWPLTVPTQSGTDTGIVAVDDDASNGTDGAAEPDEEPEFDAEKLMYDQPALLDAALARLKPQTPGKIDLYVVAFAGDAQENVFRNEAEYAERLFAQRFGAAGHVLVLENSTATMATRPLANWTNLQRSLDAIAKKMDPAEDVLLVYLTTHGSSDHQLLVDLDPLPLNQIAPDDLADALKTDPAIRWKVIVVNACYSGGFVDALRDDSTMVVASARADRTSFGCGADSDITYFGKAFLAEALNETTSIRDAFERAKKSVAQWEAADSQEHSEPQIATTPSIEAKLAAWQRTLKPGAPVPFLPAAAKEDARADAGDAEE